MPATEQIPRTLPALVTRAARVFGHREAITDGEVRLTWIQVDELRRRAARACIANGIGKGDRVAIWAPNIQEWIIAAMGLQSIGAILVPLNTRFKGAEAADILLRSGTRLLFTVSGFLGTDYPAMLKGENLPELERIVLLRGESSGLAGWNAFLNEADAISESELDKRVAQVQPSDVMDLMFTSGTTGKAKGALLTHEQNMRVYESFSGICGLSSDDNYLIVPPFFHSFGYKAGWLSCVIFGSRILPALTFDPDQLLPLIEREKVSCIPGPPTIFHGLLAHPKRKDYDISSLRLACTGAAMVPVELVRRMYSELKFEVVVIGYGLTESTAVVSLTRPSDDPVKIATTIGHPLPGTEVRCVDEQNRPVPQGQPGEIVVRGYNVMQGYFNDPEATAKAIDKDGWLHTGDVGLYDEDGYLKITDRIKDMYIAGGFNCYPAEIENILMQMPGVAQAIVIGVPDERLGEVGKAFVMRRPGAELSEAQVIAWSREHMANFKVPRVVEFVDAFPLTASGKVLKTELRAREAAKAAP
jgi:acyl-CoA synthetase (AMP-forming)/AMP-acid ligase II